MTTPLQNLAGAQSVFDAVIQHNRRVGAQLSLCKLALVQLSARAKAMGDQDGARLAEVALRSVLELEEGK